MEKTLNIVGTASKSVAVADALAPAMTLGAADPVAHSAELKRLMDSATGSVQFLHERKTLVEHRFIGYGRLQALSQDALIRLMILTRTDEMLRRWIEFKDEDTERIKAVEEFIDEIGLRRTLQKAVSTMGFMGGCYIFIDTGAEDEDLLQPLNWSERSEELSPDHKLAFRVVDPLFTTPQTFNASNPLAEDFFKPSVYLVMGRPVHHSRLIRLVEHEVVDILKPSYNFLGIPQAQLLEDYVNDFRGNREAVNRLLKKFSATALKTNLSQFLYDKGSRAEVEKRIEHLVRWRNNDGVTLVDKDTEELVQINTPLSGLDALLSQSLQFCVAVNRTNVVKTLGLSPAGFSTGESDIKSHNDMIAGLQEKVLRRPLEMLFKAITLHLYSDPAPLHFDFRPLNEEDERSLADTEKVKADTMAVYLDRGVMAPDEAREAIQQDSKNSLWGVLEGDLPDDGEPDPFESLAPKDDVDHAGEIR